MRTVVVGPKDYAALDKGQPLVLRGGSTGWVNGDRLRFIKRDMCDHEGLVARVAAVSYEVDKSRLTAVHQFERDD